MQSPNISTHKCRVKGMLVGNVDSSGFYVLFVPGSFYLELKLPDNLSESYESEGFNFVPNWDEVNN